jgi:hypothetical protein
MTSEQLLETANRIWSGGSPHATHTVIFRGRATGVAVFGDRASALEFAARQINDADVYTSERGVFFENGGAAIHITEARLGEGKFEWIG